MIFSLSLSLLSNNTHPYTSVDFSPFMSCICVCVAASPSRDASFRGMSRLVLFLFEQLVLVVCVCVCDLCFSTHDECSCRVFAVRARVPVSPY